MKTPGLRLLLVNQYYWPDQAATAQALTDLAEFLAERGHEVHVLCSAGRYDASSNTADAMPREQTHGGVRIHRVAASSFGRRGKVSQVLDFASFHAMAGSRLMHLAGDFDVVVTLTTPPLIGMHATLAARLGSGVRHVHWVMNLHPDVGIDMGLIGRGHPVARILAGMTDYQLRDADCCVSLGDCMTSRLLAKGVRPERICRIPMWGMDLPDDEGEDDFRREWGLKRKFVIMHAGNAGAICTFDVVHEAARRMNDDPRFVFLFVGSGRRMRELKDFADRHGLTNVRILPYVPRTQLARSLRTGDVHLLSLRHELTGTSVPSKLYGIMAARRPAVFIGAEECESAGAIRRYECGRVVDPFNADSLERAIRELHADPELRQRMGASGRAGYEREYNTTACCTRWDELLRRFGRAEQAVPLP